MIPAYFVRKEKAACTKGTSSLSRSDGTFHPKVSHFATVPTSLSGGKVTSEDLVDDCGTTPSHRRDDLKLI